VTEPEVGGFQCGECGTWGVGDGSDHVCADPEPGPERFALTMDDLVLFAQEGWHYPLADDEQTRGQIRAWLTTRAAA
jgi:hypothetical protein